MPVEELETRLDRVETGSSTDVLTLVVHLDDSRVVQFRKVDVIDL